MGTSMQSMRTLPPSSCMADSIACCNSGKLSVQSTCSSSSSSSLFSSCPSSLSESEPNARSGSYNNHKNAGAVKQRLRLCSAGNGRTYRL